jgi:phosphoribosylformylglycinamidine synthase subunit PurL
MNQFFTEETFTNKAVLAETLKQYGVSVTPDEAIQIKERIGRVPTMAELFVFDIEWSEHCSYKSSKHLLKKYLPTTGKYVIQGPEEDAGIVEFTQIDGKKHGIVFAHESHNHPSQVLPVEGAATGIGGIVRDVDCMGASVIGVADPLRFGDLNGKHAERSKAIVEGVVDGIQQYGNALGVPNLGGDVIFHEGYDDNCLVNVVAIGILREDEITHSRVPEGGVGFDLILVGKPTDRSGFGGASFASGTLDQDDEEENKGAVQIPDPFLKNVLLHHKATEQVRQLAHKKGITIGMKDLGAGGIACCSSEIASSAGYGIELHLEQVHIAEENLPPEIILCAETQERYLWAVPKEFTPDVLKIYNEDWDLPAICSGAGAFVIGTVLNEPVMRVLNRGEVVVDLPIDFVVEGIRYNRPTRQPVFTFSEPSIPEPTHLEEIVLTILSHPNTACKEWIYRHYDTEVQGNSVIRAGEADASLITPLDQCKVGMALSVDGNPYYGELSPFWGGATAVAEAMRNIAAIGATPRAMTDCLNYGNPEVPEHMWALEEGIKGLSEAARNLYHPHVKEPIPFVSGNVSLYNHSATGTSIPPSPIIACIGVIEDAAKAVTFELKRQDSLLVLVGNRYDELGGSDYYRALGVGKGANVPIVRYDEERGIIYGTVQAIAQSLVRASHDISAGGLLISAIEMLLALHPDDVTGLQLDIAAIPSTLRDDILLFTESSGMLLECAPDHLEALKAIYSPFGLDAVVVGKTNASGSLTVTGQRRNELLNISVQKMRETWRGAFGLTLAS